jgi:phosphoglycerol transferase
VKKKIITESGRTVPRLDLMRGALLAVLAGLVWCTFYDRWTVESWQTPLTYLSDPAKGDVIGFLAQFKAAEEGHLCPFLFTNVPELGAPYVANWDDFPIPEKMILWLTGLLARLVGLFAAANLFVMLGQMLAAVSFYAACRILGGGWILACAGGLVFAFSTYAFAHGLHHLPVLYYWHVPLCLVVCQWIFCEEGIKWGERRLVFALVVALITGLQNVYYTNMFVQFVLFGGLLQAWRHGWRKLGPALAIAGTAVGTLLIMMSNTFFYHLVYGPNDTAVSRDYKWLEIYGLKLVDLVVPPPDHPFAPFAAWGTGHLKEVILSAGESPPSGYLGILGLAALTWLVLVSVRCVASRAKPPLEAWLVLWIFLYAEVGGINGILGTLGFQLFRATTRYSIFILCLVLMDAVRRLSPWENRNKPWAALAAVLAVGLALWDQTPPLASAQDIAATAQAVASDRHFAEQLESRLPAQAMIFQIPMMDFPESPVPGIGSYDHFRLYLYAHALRFSFGSDKGRPREEWQHGLEGLPLGEVVSRLESYGFAALYVNRNGFTDRGDGLIKALNQLGITEMIESDRHDLVCLILKPSPQPILPGAF